MNAYKYDYYTYTLLSIWIEWNQMKKKKKEETKRIEILWSNAIETSKQVHSCVAWHLYKKN